jgi:tetratricopeptide (TPR) repeat protein
MKTRIISKLAVVSIILVSFLFNLTYAEDTDTIDQLIQKGIEARNSHDPQDAIQYFDQALERDPNNLRALNGKGSALFEIGNTTEAIQYFDKVLSIDPNNLNALDNKAAISIITRDFDQAAEYLNKAEKIDSNNTNTLNLQATLAGNNGKYYEAISYADRVLAQDPNNIDALNNKGAALLNIGNYTKAIEEFDMVLSNDPLNVNAMNNKATALLKMGNTDNALDLFSKVLNISPNSLSVAEKNEAIAFNSIGMKKINGTRYSHSYVEIEDRNSQGGLLSYIETNNIQFFDSNFTDKLLEKKGTTKIVTIDDKKYEEIQIDDSGVLTLNPGFVAKSGWVMNATRVTVNILVASHPAYTFQTGDTFKVHWFMFKEM